MASLWLVAGAFVLSAGFLGESASGQPRLPQTPTFQAMQRRNIAFLAKHNRLPAAAMSRRFADDELAKRRDQVGNRKLAWLGKRSDLLLHSMQFGKRGTSNLLRSMAIGKRPSLISHAFG